MTDVFAGIDPEKTFHWPQPDQKTLDAGCGIGFWLSQFERRGVEDITGLDLSPQSIAIARQRVSDAVTIDEGNIEALPYADGTFDHVNCQGVVHHTPDTHAALNELCRVLKTGGTASISVYYDNILVRLFPMIAPVIRGFFKVFGSNTGRGRDFSTVQTKDDLIRLYDGFDNPIGKSYSRKTFDAMLREAGFNSIEYDYNFFPFRFLKIPVPGFLKTIMVRLFPFMIIANLRK